ncbi:MAG: CYTH domain-containing protein, partial [Negativicutes bacterium]|nr:CYTH domain-containing protein [Negativicutes bacterium]
PDSICHDTLEASYYDTPRHALRKAKLAYRIRREGGRWVSTVKGCGSSAGGLHTRQEWNIVVEDCAASVEPFLTTPIGEKLRETVGDDKLELLFITRFERRTLLIKTADGSLVEAAADRGEIIVDDQREPIMELELEIKEGNAAALLDLGATLAERYPLLLEPRSKYYRGLLLAGIEQQDDCIQVVPVAVEGGNCASLIKAITQVLNAKAYFIRQADQEESLQRLQESLDYLLIFLGVLQRDMPELLYEDVKAGLFQFQQEVHNKQGAALATVLGTGRYTALLLKMWAWAAKRTPEGD